MWDAPLPFAGYHNTGSLSTERVLYTCVVGATWRQARRQVGTSEQEKLRLVITLRSRNWMEESEYLRYPTDEESLHYEWPNPTS